MCGTVGVGAGTGVGVDVGVGARCVGGGSRVSVSVRGRVWEIFWRYRFCCVLGVKCARMRVGIRVRVLVFYFELIVRWYMDVRWCS